MLNTVRRMCLFIIFVPMFCLADVVKIKESAPTVYVVKKGDTLWDISAMYLDKPWQWPELWRNNTHIKNPHLIYPGDRLTLVYDEQGQPMLVVEREKQKRILSPSAATTLKPAPIPLLPYDVIAPFVDGSVILSEQEYQALPHVLGAYAGNVRFAEGEHLLTTEVNTQDAAWTVIRKQQPLLDRNGETVGFQMRHIANVSASEGDVAPQSLLQVDSSRQEIKRGDRIYLADEPSIEALELHASMGQKGEVIAGLKGQLLLGKLDVVVIKLEQGVAMPGTVMGIYQAGPDIIDGDPPAYAGETNVFTSQIQGNTIKQPAIKVGELVVFRDFAGASMGLITNASEVIRPGAWVGEP